MINNHPPTTYPYVHQPKHTGAGKTTLLLALLGETVPLAGGCRLFPSPQGNGDGGYPIRGSGTGRVAYVSQRPWILNATLRVRCRHCVAVCIMPWIDQFISTTTTTTIHTSHRRTPHNINTKQPPPQNKTNKHNRRTSCLASRSTPYGTGPSSPPAPSGPTCGSCRRGICRRLGRRA